MSTLTSTRVRPAMAVGAFVAVGAITYAAIPSNNAITGCYHNETSILRVIDPAADAIH